MYTNKLTQDNPKKLNLTQINVAHNITNEKLNLTNKQLLGLFNLLALSEETKSKTTKSHIHKEMNMA